jgi:putative transposase
MGRDNNMKYDPKIHHRHSIRLKDYDYSTNRAYFITICSNNRINCFGAICRGGALLRPETELTQTGKIVNEQWYELQNRFENIEMDEFIVMPNHIHGIIVVKGRGAEQSPAPTIGDIICAYKSITTRMCNRADNITGRMILQRNYHEHIIRNEQDLQEIREYIVNNAAKWQDDRYYA